MKRFFSPVIDSLAVNAFAMVFVVHVLIVIPSRFSNAPLATMYTKSRHLNSTMRILVTDL